MSREQYVATDKRTGLEVAVTGDFPEHPQDRIRIARTSNLFARLMSTILAMESESERRDAFVAVETQMELADALIRHDMEEVQRLLQDTLQKLGITPEQMRELEEEIRRRLGEMGQGDLGPAPD
jgi:DNA/RNA-binding domain of Phe-tRNA-synthetase-like protein